MIDNKIKNVVGKSFIRVIKNHDLYNLITSSSNYSKNNPFCNFSNFNQLMDKVAEYTINNKDNSLSNDKYYIITMMINHMLHFFLEENGIKPCQLSVYGKEIFDLSCQVLYGDKYKKECGMVDDIPAPSNDFEAFIINEYLRSKDQGLINLTWDEFNKYIRKNLKNKNFIYEKSF